HQRAGGGARPLAAAAEGDCRARPGRRRARDLERAVAEDAVDLVERGRAREAESDAVVPQRRHPLLHRRGEDLLARPGDRATDGTLDRHRLVQRDPALEPGLLALLAAARTEQPEVARLVLEPELAPLLDRRRVRFAADQAEPSGKPLGDDAVDR